MPPLFWHYIARCHCVKYHLTNNILKSQILEPSFCHSQLRCLHPVLQLFIVCLCVSVHVHACLRFDVHTCTFIDMQMYAGNGMHLLCVRAGVHACLRFWVSTCLSVCRSMCPLFAWLCPYPCTKRGLNWFRKRAMISEFYKHCHWHSVQ